MKHFHMLGFIVTTTSVGAKGEGQRGAKGAKQSKGGEGE